MKIPINELFRGFRYQHLRVVHRSRDPHSAALSFGLGVFLGFMPLSVFATVLALFIPRRLGLRTIPAVVGTFTSNWITGPFIVGASMVVGQLVTTGSWTGFHELMPASDLSFQGKIDEFMALGLSFFLGITLVSLFAAGVGYSLVFWSVQGAVRLRRQKLVARLAQKLHHHGHATPGEKQKSAPPNPPDNQPSPTPALPEEPPSPKQ